MKKRRSLGGSQYYARETGINMGQGYCSTCLYRVKGPRKGRRALGKPTSETQANVNERHAKEYYSAMLNSNFEEGRDLKADLTFDSMHEPESWEGAKRKAENFIRRVKRAWASEGIGEPLRYVYQVCGGEGTRFHVHLTMTGGLSPVKLRELWGMATVVNFDILQGGKNGFEGWAVYTARQKRPEGKHRWYGSRNLFKPDKSEQNAHVKLSEVEELAKVIEDINAGADEGIKTTAERYAPIEERYPRYYLSEAEAKYIEEFREWVIHIKLYRKDTEAGRAETKRRRAEAREIAQRRAAFGVL